ncbi:MAG: DUF559 domain-containing protein [Rhodococcus sp. (in: high G+C Gram-positive bacteria)]
MPEIEHTTVGTAQDLSKEVRSPWYSDPAVKRVTLLRGTNIHAVTATLDPLPPGAPAVIAIETAEVVSQGQVVAHVLDALETAARRLFPAWLPGAEDLDGPSRLERSAARKLAMRLAAETDHFGPFLSALAESALTSSAGTTSFIDKTRAQGIRRVLADTFDREAVALLINATPHIQPDKRAQLFGACEWLAQQGGFAVWVVGPDSASDRVRIVDFERGPKPGAGFGTARQIIHIPAIAGRPHPGSTAENKLERALAQCLWAWGREWNQPFQPTPLHERVVVDLRWPTEKCVVEVDGSEHRQPVKFARDRQRDVVLQLHGHAVLRFTNEQVLEDVAAVVSAIESFIENKRDTMFRSTHRRDST